MTKQIITLVVDNPYDIEDVVMENVCSDWLNKECGVIVEASWTKEKVIDECKGCISRGGSPMEFPCDRCCRAFGDMYEANEEESK